MKNLYVTIRIFAIITIFSCTKQQENFPEIPKIKKDNKISTSTFFQQTEEKIFTRTVGLPIDVKIGKRWIENYNRINHSNGMSYILEVKELKAILKNPSCVGICLYYGMDNFGRTHILPIGIDENEKIIKSTFINTQAGSISWGTAQQWIKKYSGVIHAHFFGGNTFDRLFKDVFCKQIKAIFALNDFRQQQLLLIDASGEDKKNYEDESRPCSENCP